jgi:hypothetical protein
MSSTESRSAFRLPWSSDRSHDSQSGDVVGEPMTDSAPATSDGAAWPVVEPNTPFSKHPGLARPSDAFAVESAPGAMDQPAPDTAHQEAAMLDTVPATPAPAAPRKPSKLMADLSAAIRATAEAARAEALAKVDADMATVIADIRVSSKEGEAALKLTADDDIARVREWSKAEIARIKEETEARIEARKSLLGDEIEAHAAAIERRVGGVQALASSYRTDMAAHADQLVREDDPSRLATLAESMPEPPDLALATPLDPVDPGVAETNEPAGEADEPAADEPAAAVADDAVAEAVMEAEAVAEAAWSEPAVVAGASVEGEPVVAVEADSPKADADGPWETPATLPADTAPRSAQTGENIPRWDGSEAPDGFSGPVEGIEPVDRVAIMAALEAAAEAVVAAEAAAESADQAETAAGVAETAAELVVGRSGSGEEQDPEAQAAYSARMDAGGFDTQSFADRLASLLPSHEPVVDDGSSRTTQVIVSGLVSVASIASFKRHLGRIAGVEAVAVASGPDGEFVFNVTHRSDVSFRDAVPTMPGFAARVTSAGDGVVTVSARDPEAEG